MSANRSRFGLPGQACRASRSARLKVRRWSNDSPMSSNSASKTQRMVNTVGPASMDTPPTGSPRTLPPGRPARSRTRTSKPWCANSKAATKPPMPAPTTATRAKLKPPLDPHFTPHSLPPPSPSRSTQRPASQTKTRPPARAALQPAIAPSFAPAKLERDRKVAQVPASQTKTRPPARAALQPAIAPSFAPAKLEREPKVRALTCPQLTSSVDCPSANAVYSHSGVRGCPLASGLKRPLRMPWP